LRGEEDRHIVPISDILRALPDVEGDLRRSLTAVAAEDFEDDVLDGES
jgi:hypothetical protein